MTAGEVVALMRRAFGASNVLLSADQVEQLRRLLELHEADVRERCAVIAETGMEDSLEAALIAAAIRGEST